MSSCFWEKSQGIPLQIRGVICGFRSIFLLHLSFSSPQLKSFLIASGKKIELLFSIFLRAIFCCHFSSFIAKNPWFPVVFPWFFPLESTFSFAFSAASGPMLRQISPERRQVSEGRGQGSPPPEFRRLISPAFSKTKSEPMPAMTSSGQQNYALNMY